MGRIYAGVLGTLAFVTVLARSLVQTGGVESSIWQAIVCLLLFALIGGALGQLAGWIVDDSVRARLAAEMAVAAATAKQNTPATASKTNLAATTRTSNKPNSAPAPAARPITAAVVPATQKT